VRAVFDGSGADLPAARVVPTDGGLVWMMDRAAGAGVLEYAS
jgi:hypothetical protein